MRTILVQARRQPRRDQWLPWGLDGERTGPPEDSGAPGMAAWRTVEG